MNSRLQILVTIDSYTQDFTDKNTQPILKRIAKAANGKSKSRRVVVGNPFCDLNPVVIDNF